MPLYFPQMHPDLLPESWRARLPEAVRFLDPGLGKPGSPNHLRPADAPFDQRTAKALLADTLRFGENMPNPRDIAAQALLEQSGALSPESSRAVLSEVEQSLGLSLPSQPQAQEPAEEARKQAQMLLLLAWNLEERLLELHGIESGLKTAWARLDQSVSAGAEVVDDESDQEALALGRELSGLTLPDASAMNLPWRKLVESFAVLVPDQPLATLDAEIGAALAEAEIQEAPLDDMPGALRVFRAPLFRFMGLERLPEAKPWLDAPLTLGVFAATDGEE